MFTPFFHFQKKLDFAKNLPAFILLISYCCPIQCKTYTVLQEKYFWSSQTFNLPEYVLVNGQHARKPLFSQPLFFNLFPLSPLVVSQFNVFFMKVYSGFLSPEPVPAFLRQQAELVGFHNIMFCLFLLLWNETACCLPAFLASFSVQSFCCCTFSVWGGHYMKQ